MSKQELLNSAATYGVKPDEDWASLVLVQVFANDDQYFEREPIGWVFIIDPKFKKSAKYKNSGGHKSVEKGDQTPRDTAQRECRGETGLDFPVEAFEHVGTWQAQETREGSPHKKCFFKLKIHRVDTRMLNEYDPENEGEFPRYFAVEGFWALVRSHTFHPFHYADMVNYGFIEPLQGPEIPWVSVDVEI